MKKISRLSPLVISLITASVLSAQGILERDTVPLKNWDAPMYWQPNQSEELKNQARAEANRTGAVASDVGTQAQTPASSLVFIGMTPCRVVQRSSVQLPSCGLLLGKQPYRHCC
jgi:hypothetical protein